MLSFGTNDCKGLFLTCQTRGCNKGREFVGITAVLTNDTSVFHLTLYILQFVQFVDVILNYIIIYILQYNNL